VAVAAASRFQNDNLLPKGQKLESGSSATSKKDLNGGKQSAPRASSPALSNSPASRAREYERYRPHSEMEKSCVNSPSGVRILDR
jgi:hypothetical protein